MTIHTEIQGFKPMDAVSLTESFNISDSLVFILKTSNVNYSPIFIEMNDLTYKTLGYTKRELLEMTLYDLVDESNKNVLDVVNNTLLDELSVEYEIVLVRKDGNKIRLYVESIVFHSGTCRIECAIAKLI